MKASNVPIINLHFSTKNQRVYEHSSVQKSAPWNLDRIDQSDWPLDGVYNIQGDGTGVNIYIADSGIRTSHNEFGGRARCGLDAVNEDGRNDCFDGRGHGEFSLASHAFCLAIRLNLIFKMCIDEYYRDSCSRNGWW